MSRTHPKSNQKSPDHISHRRDKPLKQKLTCLWVSLGFLVVAVAGILLLNSKAAPSFEISTTQAYAKYQQGAYFLDVRSQEEWDQFHIEGSNLIPLDQLQNRLSELPGDEDIVVVCRSGRRSQSGVTVLQQAGFSHLSSLSGGLQAWTAAGYPVEGKSP